LFDIQKYLTISRVNVPFPKSESVRALPVSISRGCPFRCSFCYFPNKRYSYRRRSPARACEEIRRLKSAYGVNFIDFSYDDLALMDREQTQALVEEIERCEAKFYWAATCRAGLLDERDRTLIRRMKECGCVGLSYSLESGDAGLLKDIKKGITVEGYLLQTRLLHDVGIKTWSCLVFGYPNETVESIQRTFDVCYEANIYPSVGYLLPLPGTRIYQELVKSRGWDDEDYLLSKISERQDLRLNFTQLPTEVIEDLVRGNLLRLADKLGLEMPADRLVKTGHRVAPRVYPQ
jgi:anaerobic magnesium-protoporphyrin IX monomethyl ester cyclase